MVVATSNDSIFQLLLKQSDQPTEVSAELVEDLRLEWVEKEALSRITTIDLTHEIMMDRWISVAEQGPVPIGREAIRNDRRLSNLGPDLLPMPVTSSCTSRSPESSPDRSANCSSWQR